MLISNEPLEIIRQNECDDTLTGSRFRRVFQELDRLQKREQQIAAALAELRADCEQQVFLIGGINDDYAEGVKFALKSLNATITKLGLEVTK